jgi:hypothetical protein
MYKEQWRVIKKLAYLFETNNIHYHYDASTTVFVHGIEFEMDDIDIVFMWNEENTLKEVLKDYIVSETKYMKEIGLKYFFSEIDGQKIHCLFYGDEDTIATKEEFNSNAAILSIDGQNIMAQSLEFYLRYSKDKNNLRQRIISFLSEKEKKC